MLGKLRYCASLFVAQNHVRAACMRISVNRARAGSCTGARNSPLRRARLRSLRRPRTTACGCHQRPKGGAHSYDFICYTLHYLFFNPVLAARAGACSVFPNPPISMLLFQPAAARHSPLSLVYHSAAPAAAIALAALAAAAASGPQSLVNSQCPLSLFVVTRCSPPSPSSPCQM